MVRYFQWWNSRRRKDDVVVIEREIFDDPTTTFEERFRHTARSLVLDLDDAVFLRYPEKFERLARMVDLIVCGNSFIQEWAQTRNPRTILIPTCVEMARYTAKDWARSQSRPVTIGWTGTAGNIRYLQVVATALRRLSANFTFELLVISSDASPLSEIDLRGINVRFVTWSASREIEQLSEIDIGLMPLFSTEEWDKYKCGLKLIQYMAIGIPAVATPVGVNGSIVTDRQDGFLAGDDEAWESTLRQLLLDGHLRQAIGAKARETARSRYSIEANFPLYEAALADLVQRK